jgi:hypothetical protein
MKEKGAMYEISILGRPVGHDMRSSVASVWRHMADISRETESPYFSARKSVGGSVDRLVGSSVYISVIASTMP